MQGLRLLLALVCVLAVGVGAGEVPSAAALFNYEVLPWLSLSYPGLFPAEATQELLACFSWVNLPVKARLSTSLGAGVADEERVSRSVLFTLRELPAGLPPGPSWEEHRRLSSRLSSHSSVEVSASSSGMLEVARSHFALRTRMCGSSHLHRTLSTMFPSFPSSPSSPLCSLFLDSVILEHSSSSLSLLSPLSSSSQLPPSLSGASSSAILSRCLLPSNSSSPPMLLSSLLPDSSLSPSFSIFAPLSPSLLSCLGSQVDQDDDSSLLHQALHLSSLSSALSSQLPEPVRLLLYSTSLELRFLSPSSSPDLFLHQPMSLFSSK